MIMRVGRNWKPRFLRILREIPVVGHACKAAGICRKTAYNHRNRFPKFAAAWDDAIEEGVDMLQAEAHRRAMAGSDSLLMFLLRAYRPEVYGNPPRSKFSRKSDAELVRKAYVVFATDDEPATDRARELADFRASMSMARRGALPAPEGE